MVLWSTSRSDLLLFGTKNSERCLQAQLNTQGPKYRLYVWSVVRGIGVSRVGCLSPSQLGWVLASLVACTVNGKAREDSIIST